MIDLVDDSDDPLSLSSDEQDSDYEETKPKKNQASSKGKAKNVKSSDKKKNVKAGGDKSSSAKKKIPPKKPQIVAAKGKEKENRSKKGSASSTKTTASPFKASKFTQEQILQEVQVLKARMDGADSTEISIKDLGYTNVHEVADLDASKVMFEIEKLIVKAAQSILVGQGFHYDVPARSSTANQLYIQELDRIVLQDKTTPRIFTNTSHVRKTTITTRIMQLVHEVLSKGIHITKRDMFYTDVKLFGDQKDSDVVLEDVACMLGCTRTCLNVVASDKGLVVGRVIFNEDGDHIDCTKMGVGGKAIPPYIDKIANIRSDAVFILLVEKEAAYMRLAEDRFYNKYPCIIITAKGQPDVATRLFLKRLKKELGIPVLGLVDSDPYGLKILSVYMSGSKNMAYDSASLTTPDIKWLGIRPSDLDKYKIPEQCRLDMTDTDIATGKSLLEEEFVKKNPEWVRELQLMLKMKKKAEIQALSAFGFQYLTEHYLPQKLKNADWI